MAHKRNRDYSLRKPPCNRTIPPAAISSAASSPACSAGSCPARPRPTETGRRQQPQSLQPPRRATLVNPPSPDGHPQDPNSGQPPMRKSPEYSSLDNTSLSVAAGARVLANDTDDTGVSLIVD